MVNSCIWISQKEQDTVDIGQKLAHMVRAGDTIALIGTLGMGKSVLARALIQELTQAEEVPSPTFTLLQTYQAPDFEIFHYDLYRIKSPDEIFELGIEEALHNAVTLIEWPEKMGGYLPKNAFILEITPHGLGRQIRISCDDPQKLRRLREL